MKRIFAYTLVIYLLSACAGFCLAEENQYQIENGFLTGSIVLFGNEVKLDALFDGAVPEQAKRITLKPRA